MAEEVLFCLEEIERLNILVERAIGRGTLTRADLSYAELEMKARRADRLARTRADRPDIAEEYLKTARRLRQQLSKMQLEATASTPV